MYQHSYLGLLTSAAAFLFIVCTAATAQHTDPTSTQDLRSMQTWPPPATDPSQRRTRAQIEQQYVAQELALTEQELGAFLEAAEDVAMSPAEAIHALQQFKRITDDFSLNTGSTFMELLRAGAGPVVREINQAKTTREKIKIAYRFRESILLAENSPTVASAKASRWLEMLGLGGRATRLSEQSLGQKFF